MRYGGTADEYYGTLQVGGVLLTEDSQYFLTLSGSCVLALAKENRSEVFNNELIMNGLPFGIGSGQYTQNVIGGASVEASGDPAEISGNTSLVIDGGEFSRNLFCGDRVLSGSQFQPKPFFTGKEYHRLRLTKTTRTYDLFCATNF